MSTPTKGASGKWCGIQQSCLSSARLTVRLLAAGVALMAASAVASAQGAPPTSNYPAQSVRMIVATAAGGGLDAFARVLARDFSAKAGQQFIVENRPGAGTMIASTAVARVKPDGYTVLVNIPTIAESGVPGYESAQWYGLFARAGTPQDIIDWLYRETASSLRATSTKERLAADGLEVIANTPDEFAAFIRTDIVKWTKVVKVTGIPLM